MSAKKDLSTIQDLNKETLHEYIKDTFLPKVKSSKSRLEKAMEDFSIVINVHANDKIEVAIDKIVNRQSTKIIEKIPFNKTKDTKRNAERKKIKVTFENGKSISGDKVIDTYIRTVKAIGLKKIAQAYDEKKLKITTAVSKSQFKLTSNTTQQKEGSYWIYTTSSTEQKVKDLKEINKYFSLKLKISTY